MFHITYTKRAIRKRRTTQFDNLYTATAYHILWALSYLELVQLHNFANREESVKDRFRGLFTHRSSLETHHETYVSEQGNLIAYVLVRHEPSN